MNNWIKTCCGLASQSVVRLICIPATVIVSIILFGSNALTQSDSERLGMSANELARKVVTNELKFHDEDHSRWMYRLEKEESGKKQIQEILETSDGSLSQLLSIGGHPLSAKQQNIENQRMQTLVSHPKVRVPRARLTCHLVVFVSSLIAISVVLSGCAKQAKPVVGTGEIAPSISKATYDAYRQSGWVPLLEPDSRFVPSTIFETRANTAPRWISSLEACGVPKKVLAPC